MKSNLKSAPLVASFCLVASVGAAQADTVNGSIWENTNTNTPVIVWSTGCACAVQSNVPTRTADVTFTSTWIPGSGQESLNFSSEQDLTGMPNSGFSIGAFLNNMGLFTTNPGINTATVITGQNQLNNTMANTIFVLTGTVTLTNGQIVEGSDDGSTLIIGGVTLTPAGNAGAQGFSLNNHITWNGGNGTFLFELIYGKSGFGPPAQVVVELPENPAATPIPAALPLFATGIGGLGLLGWRRKRRAQAVA
jgi:hypothetical protein